MKGQEMDQISSRISNFDRIFEYSRHYGNILQAAGRLNRIEEYFAACLLLFSATEVVLKSLCENFSGSFGEDVLVLRNKGLLTDDDVSFINGPNGLRIIRNAMLHKDAHQHFFEDELGVFHPFTESDTWRLIFEDNWTNTINMIASAIEKSRNPKT
ncbi:MAG: hypothetical protein ACOX7B_12820 [Christensenellales bacterium]